MQLQIEQTTERGYCVVTPRGEIDLATNGQLKEAINDRVVAGDVHLVVDLTQVEFIDSTGLGALIGGRRRAHAFKGSFALVCGQEQFLKLFRITGLDRVFEIHESLEEALARPLGEAGQPA